VRRVVARAHGVHVVPLHQQHVIEHVLLGDGAAAVGVELVPVDPAQQHAPAVDGEQPVRDAHRPEAHAQVDALGVGHHLQVVEPGQLGAPRLHAGQAHLLAGRGVDAELGQQHAGPRIPGDVHAQRAVPVLVAGVHEHVVHAARRPRQQRHVPEDPGHPPHVLVLEVAPRRPLVHPDRHEVVRARPDDLGDVELGGQPAALCGAHLVSVHPDRETGVDALEPQHDPPARPVGRHRDPTPVAPRRVLGRHPGRVDREGVARVGVRGCAVAVQLPVGGHREQRPPGVVETRLGEPRRGLLDGRRQVEPPLPVQAQPGCVRARRRAGREHAGVRARVLVVRQGGH
jgi:hypothetical protein